jgi:hypothetical protein
MSSIIAQWGDRMDFTIPFIENTDETWIREYGEKRRRLVNKLGNFASTTFWLKKYLLYARSLKPDLPEKMRILLEDYLVAIAKHGVRGLPRKLEALERTAIGFAKLKLKEVVDEEEDRSHLLIFFGQLRERLITILTDSHERIVPNVMEWELTECDLNKDVNVTDWFHYTGLKIQVKHMNHLFDYT